MRWACQSIYAYPHHGLRMMVGPCERSGRSGTHQALVYINVTPNTRTVRSPLSSDAVVARCIRKKNALSPRVNCRCEACKCRVVKINGMRASSECVLKDVHLTENGTHIFDDWLV